MRENKKNHKFNHYFSVTLKLAKPNFGYCGNPQTLIIYNALRNLALFAQFKKHEKL